MTTYRQQLAEAADRVPRQVTDPEGTTWTIERDGPTWAFLTNATGGKWVTQRELASWSRPVVNFDAPEIPVGFEGLRNVGGGRWVRDV